VLTFDLEAQSISQLRLEPGRSLAPARARARVQRNFVLSEITASIVSRGNESQPIPLKIVRAEADASKKSFQWSSVEDEAGKGWPSICRMVME